MFELREYQKEPFKKMVYNLKKYNLSFLAGQMRTGKTLISLMTAKEMNYKTLAFITTKKNIKNVNSDVEKIIEFEKIKIDVINLESAHKLKNNYDCIIIDESHKLGTYPKPSQRTLKIKALCGNKPIMLLSGTPSPESFSQFYHQFWVSDFSPFEEPTFYKWAINYIKNKKIIDNYTGKIKVEYIQKRIGNGRTANNYDLAIKEKILPVIEHLMVTITKEDSGWKYFKPIEKIINVKTPEFLIDVFKKSLKNKLIQLDDKILKITDFAQLKSKMHQFASGHIIASYYLNSDLETIVSKPYFITNYLKPLIRNKCLYYNKIKKEYFTYNFKPKFKNFSLCSKMEEILEFCKTIKTIEDLEEKFKLTKNDYIIVSDYKVKYIKKNYKDKKIAVYYLFSSEKEMLINEFKEQITEDHTEFEENENMIYISQFVSGREGVKLSTADILIFFNIEFSALSYMQTISRIEDFERETEPEIHFLCSETGLEEKIYNVVKNKEKDYTLVHFKKDFLK